MQSDRALHQRMFALGHVAVQRAGLIPTIVGMGIVYVVVTIGMFFNPALRGDGCPPRAGRRTDGRTAGSSGW